MKRVVMLLVFSITCVALSHLSVRAVHTQGVSCLVTTISGDVQGPGSRSVLCVPRHPIRRAAHGESSVGAPAARDAVGSGDVQRNHTTAGVRTLNSATGQAMGSEDCLKLNIWTPNPIPASGAPVIVWIHPGSFVNASANFAPQNGQNLAALTGAIVVAPGYRLGPFGFLRHSALVVRRRSGRELWSSRSARRAGLGSRSHRRVRRESRQRDDRRTVCRRA